MGNLGRGLAHNIDLTLCADVMIGAEIEDDPDAIVARGQLGGRRKDRS